FFPEIHKQIDFDTISFLSEELFTDTFDGDKRILDLVVEVKWKETDALIAIHVEPQSYRQADFNERMFAYFSLLYQKIERPIIPIAIFSYEDEWEEDEFRIEFLDLEVLRFSYVTLHLKKLDWRTFIKNDNPVSAALLSKMGYTNDERVQVKLEFFKILARLKLDRENTGLLLGFFESYLSLTTEEEETFVKQAKRLDNAEEILEIPISYEEKGKEIGKEIGKEMGQKIGEKIGREETQSTIALNMLRKGLDTEFIADTTMLSKDAIVELRKQLD